MKTLQFISTQHIEEAVKFLASKGHLPYTDASGTPNHRLMGAAWAALHGGYRGNKYEGKDKAGALTKLTALYKSEKMDTPEESFSLDGEFFQEALAKSDSFDAIRCQVMSAIAANIKAGIDMDGDDDGAEDSGRCSGCGCNCGREFGCSCCVECGCTYPKYAWCMDLFPLQVVYSMDGKMMQCDYSISGDEVTLSDPIEVETSYTPVHAADAQESFRVLALSTTPFEESAYDAASGKLTMTVIKPGLNKSKARFYPKETLTRDYKVFENAKMFADHQTEKAAKEQPEGSVNNWVAQISKVWPESDGTIKATAIVIDPPFKAKLESLNKSGLLHEMGVSIRAIGEASEGERDGVTTNVVESLIAARSVDFVTYAGAGGQIEAMESATEDNDLDVDLVTEAGLRKRRPDLVQLVEKHAQETTMKSLEQQLKESKTGHDTLTAENADLKKKFSEAQTAATKLAEDRKAADKTTADLLKENATQLKTLTESNIELTGKIEAAEKATAKATVANELTKRLNESKLPEISQNRIRKQFAEAAVIDGIKEAITEELAYVKSLGGKLTTKNLGAGDNGTTRESENVAPTKEQMAEAFQSMGLNETESKLAAKM